MGNQLILLDFFLVKTNLALIINLHTRERGCSWCTPLSRLVSRGGLGALGCAMSNDRFHLFGGGVRAFCPSIIGAGEASRVGG